MILAFANRLDMIRTLSSGSVGNIVELGVYKGEFAQFCYDVLKPAKQVLIDFWDYDSYDFILDGAPQSLDREEIFRNYFDNDPQRVLRQAYEQVKDTFSQRSSVQIIKADIAAAAQEFPDQHFDIIYLDGNHTYEYVLRDLFTWYPKLAPGGLFVCNDFFESKLAAKQNIGVIPAFLTFAKRHSTYPIALSMSDWSDFYFSNQATSPLIDRFCNGLSSAGHNTVEVPSEILGSYHHRLITSRAGQQLIPSFTKLGIDNL